MKVFVIAVSTALVVSFLCSIFESVLLSINHAQIETLAGKNQSAANLLRDFKRRIDMPIAAILITNTVAHTMGAAVAGASYEQAFSSGTLWIFTIVFTIAVLLFTEIIPKTLGVTHALKLAAPVAFGIRSLVFALLPFVRLSGKISRALTGGKRDPITSIEEIRLLTSLGRTEGVVGSQTAKMITGASRLRDLTASDVMLHRHQVVFLSSGNSREETLETIRQSRHSRFPFSTSGLFDQVSGVVLAKEVLLQAQEDRSESINWSTVVQDAIVVPENVSLDSLLRTFREEQRHMAIVVDEYGDAQGIVTLEDVLEEIVGDIFDESDEPRVDIWPQPDGSVHALASTKLRKLCRHLDIDLPVQTRVSRLGGLVSDELGRVPVAGDTFEWNGCRISVLDADQLSADRISIRRIAQ